MRAMRGRSMRRVHVPRPATIRAPISTTWSKAVSCWEGRCSRSSMSPIIKSLQRAFAPPSLQIDSPSSRPKQRPDGREATFRRSKLALQRHSTYRLRGRKMESIKASKTAQSMPPPRTGDATTMAISLNVNGSTRSVDADPETPLLYVLRNDLELNGAKFGCGLSQCGACTVLINGAAVRSCVMPIGFLGQNEITTIEGLGTLEKPHPLQTAFIEEQAAQCGYCINGMIMSAADLLKRNPQPKEDDVRAALAANLCRCGTHNRIIRAVMRAAQANGRT